MFIEKELLKPISYSKLNQFDMMFLLKKENIIHYLMIIRKYIDKYWKIYKSMREDSPEYKGTLRFIIESGGNPEIIKHTTFSTVRLYYLSNLIDLHERKPNDERKFKKEYIFLILQTNELLIERLCECVKRLASYKVEIIPESEDSRPYTLLCESCFSAKKSAYDLTETYEKLDKKWASFHVSDYDAGIAKKEKYINQLYLNSLGFISFKVGEMVSGLPNYR